MKPIIKFLLPLAFALSACDSSDNGRAKTLQGEIDALTQKQFEAQQAAKRLEGQIEASRAERAKLEEERDKVSAERDAAKKQVEQMQKEFDNYKSLYKVSIRRRAPGMKLEDFAIDGTTFQQVTLLELTDSLINFTHNTGVKKVELKKLPFHLQAILGFSEGESPRAVAMGKPLSVREQKDRKALAIDQAEERSSTCRDNINEAKKRIAAAETQKKIQQSRQQPILPLVQYLEQMDLTVRRLELQLSESEIERYELMAQQRRSMRR
jgi:septal ring factor EnvC (AmiA/AmiB activator)